MRILLAMAMTAVLAGGAAAAQPTGCDSSASRQLDFWLGNWSLSHVQDGKTVQSRNHVTKVLDGCAVQEDFEGPPGTPLVGRSLSVFDTTTGQWRQTWVDNGGGYLEFTGGMEGDRMVLRREFTRAGRRIQQRMVFQDIAADRLLWLWQHSDDAGSTWKTDWEIAYRRADGR